ncbi:unnamed protein product, partial [Scytosiphon promiscuus]
PTRGGGGGGGSGGWHRSGCNAHGRATVPAGDTTARGERWGSGGVRAPAPPAAARAGSRERTVNPAAVTSAVEDVGATPSFAVSLPDTCDILDAESPPTRSPAGTRTELLILTPPSFEVGQTATKEAAAAAAGGTMDPAIEGEQCKDVAGPRASLADGFVDVRKRGEVEFARVGDGGSVGTSATDSSGECGRKTVSAQEKSRDGTRLPSSQGQGREELFLEGSGSEDESSEAESVPLLCGGGAQTHKHGQQQQQAPQHQQHQHQLGTGQTTSSRDTLSPRSRRPKAGGEVDCSSDRTETPLTPVVAESLAEEGEEDGEETCDEAASPFHRIETRVASIDGSNGGEPPSRGADSEQQRRATGVKALEPPE